MPCFFAVVFEPLRDPALSQQVDLLRHAVVDMKYGGGCSSKYIRMVMP
jgi:hypothetical protein